MAKQRFPKPEFEKKYTVPDTQIPASRALWLEYFDVFMLVICLSVVTWFVLKKRSRLGVLSVSVFSIIYFGFYRKGCVCAVGSMQNITLGLFNTEYHIPLTVIAFFIIPLLFTLFFGRTFCAGVCPLGAIQDIVALRSISLKKWVQAMLGLIPFVYLGLAILYAATSTDFVICRYDPFIGIYRLNASFLMFSIGAILLLMGIFIARPYCRFLCPYGVLLNWVSRISKKHLTITPAECIDCRLCEDSCPFGAIQIPTPEKIRENRFITVKRLMFFCIVIPLLIFLGGWTGSRFYENLSMVNLKVRLANELLMSKNEANESQSIEITTFKSQGKPEEKLYSEASVIVKQFYSGGWILGGFIGLVFGLTLAQLTFVHYQKGYTPNKGTCLSCGRCMDYCPVKKGEK